jgi:hypothetical protein
MQGDFGSSGSLNEEEKEGELSHGGGSSKVSEVWIVSTGDIQEEISTAKQPETIERRLQETLAALASGRKWAQRKG